jgi:ankyrin repeat protein
LEFGAERFNCRKIIENLIRENKLQMKPQIDQVAKLRDALAQNEQEHQWPRQIRIKKTLTEISQLEEIDPRISGLIEEIFSTIDVEEKFPENVALICSKLGDSHPNYERLLEQSELDPNDFGNFKIHWLISKVEKISSPQKAEELIEYLSGPNRRISGMQTLIATVIGKSTNKLSNLERFLNGVYNDKALIAILNEMDGLISDQNISQHILRSAIFADNSELFDLLVEKSAITPNYDLALIEAIDWGRIWALNEMLARGANANAISKNSDDRSGFALEQVLYSDCKKEVETSLIESLLAHGAKLSLIGSENQLSIVRMLQEKSNYEELNKALWDDYETSEKHPPKIFLSILRLAFEKDDANLIEMLHDRDLDFNSKMPLSWLGYVREGDNDTLALVSALHFNKPNICTLLAKNKANAGNYPVIAKAVLSGNNLVLKALCENGYNLGQTIKNYFEEEKHPLTISIDTKNTQAFEILIQHITAEELLSLSDKLLPQLISSDSDRLFLLAVEKGAAIEPKKHPHLIIEACRKGMLGAVKYLHSQGFDLNAKFKEHPDYQFPTSPIVEAVTNKQNDVTSYLLQNDVVVGDLVVFLAVEKNTPIDLLRRIVEKTNSIDQTAGWSGESALHLAIKSQNKDAFNLLLSYGADPLVSDYVGKSALHHAAQMGDKEFFDALIASREIRPDLMHDKRGNNVYYHALYHQNDQALEVPNDYFPFDLNVFYDLLEFVQTKALEHHESELKGVYAAKLACLFDSVEQLESYMQKYQPKANYWGDHFHDLTLFTIPQEKNWDKEAWRNLAMEHGPELSKYLFLAEKIEAKLGRLPQNLEEIKLQAKSIKYPRASEFSELAEVFYENAIPDHVFNRVLESYSPKTADNIPDILIEGSSFGADRFYMKKLAPNDLRGFILGNKTNCCQYVGAEGNDCAEHGMTSPFGGFYAVFKREKEGRVNNLKNWLDNLEQSESEADFLQSLSDKAVRQKYQKIIAKTKKDLQTSTIFLPPFEQIKQVLRQTFLKELEGEIVAQSWVWISEDNNLVLDSWERLREEDDVLLKPFLRKLSEEILLQNEEIKKILIGKGGYTPKNFALSDVKKPEIPRDYKAYRDSAEQFLIAQKEPTKPIKFNDAIFIEEDRMRELKSLFDEQEKPQNFAKLKLVQNLAKQRQQEKLK